VKVLFLLNKFPLPASFFFKKKKLIFRYTDQKCGWLCVQQYFCRPFTPNARGSIGICTGRWKNKMECIW
jgi:hypothetical protein